MLLKCGEGGEIQLFHVNLFVSSQVISRRERRATQVAGYLGQVHVNLLVLTQSFCVLHSSPAYITLKWSLFRVSREMVRQRFFELKRSFTDVTLVWLHVGVSQSVQVKCAVESKSFPTYLTDEWPLSRVSDAVQTEIPLCFQYFSADFANNSFGRVHPVFVVTEGWFVGETFVAQGAFERLFREMETYVVFQPYHHFECFATGFTFEWSFIRMNKPVVVKELLGGPASPTYLAGVTLVFFLLLRNYF